MNVVPTPRATTWSLPGDSAGGFGARTDFATGSAPNSVAIGDVNGDGRPDLVTANFSAGTVSVLLGDGMGASAAATRAARVVR